jgi:acetyltransferase-like isoleucine patch superfamily enzyme
MSNILPSRRVEHDWYDHPIPDSVVWGEGFYAETSQIFRFIRSENSPAVILGEHVSCYSGCSFSIGKKGRCTVGDYSLLNGALIMAEESVTIGSHCLISWNVGIADSDFHPVDPALRRIDTHALAPYAPDRPPRPEIGTAPVVIGDNVWIGMGAVILKGVTIGDNSVVAAGSIVTKDIPPNVVVAGNPARVVKEL